MTPQQPLRLWPGVVAVVLQWLVRFALPIVVPGSIAIGMIGELVGWLAIVVWWVFFSRAPRLERWIALPLMAAAVLATSPFLHKSIAGGMMGMLFLISVIPGLSLALVVWAVATQRWPDGRRRASMVAAMLLASGAWILLRTDGISGEASSELAWRWTKTAEEKLLAQANNEPMTITPVSAAVKVPEERAAAPATTEAPKIPAETAGATRPATEAAKAVADWPGFRGPGRNGIVSGARMETDWSASPPVELWRRPVGPGWSSFAVQGDLIYTQEQRGEDEVVACYHAATGKPVWQHRDPARFWESNAGAGPRATPTLSDGRVYTFGATGIVNVLDAGTGAVVWARNAAAETETKVPGWGFSSSPLVVDDVVIVAATGRMIAYDRHTGNRRWLGPPRGDGYSSPHLMTIGGVPQVLLISAKGTISVAPASGTMLWEHPWSGGSVIVQPAQTLEGDVLVSAVDDSGGVLGLRRLALAQGPQGWAVEERWTTNGLKPYFNDFVIHAGHAFGFDGSILACIDLKDGKRKWKGGRYGYGQLVLLPEQNAMLVVSEEGELVLVAAATDQFKELARVPGIEGKTWNHPALAGNVLLVRNSQEMAAFRLPVSRR